MPLSQERAAGEMPRVMEREIDLERLERDLERDLEREREKQRERQRERERERERQRDRHIRDDVDRRKERALVQEREAEQELGDRDRERGATQEWERMRARLLMVETEMSEREQQLGFKGGVQTLALDVGAVRSSSASGARGRGGGGGEDSVREILRSSHRWSGF